MGVLGVLTPVIWFMWFESVDDLLLTCLFPQFGFTQAKFQTNIKRGTYFVAAPGQPSASTHVCVNGNCQLFV